MRSLLGKFISILVIISMFTIMVNLETYTIKGAEEVLPEKYTQTDYLSTNSNSIFSDFSNSHWAARYVDYMVDKGIISGYADGTFKPNANFSRAALAKLLLYTFDLEPYVGTDDFLTDVPSTHWAYPYIIGASDYLLFYNNDGSYAFHPNEGEERECVAVSVVNAMEIDLSLADLSYLNQFKDKDLIEEEYRAHVALAVQYGVMNGTGENFEPKGYLTRAQACTLFARFMQEIVGTYPVEDQSVVAIEDDDLPLSGTRAINIIPVDGVRISAEANALDINRTIDFHELSDSEELELQKELFEINEIMCLEAFEFDAGLEADEHIPGLFNIEMDLNELGIETELHDYIRLLRIGEDGSKEVLVSELHNGVLKAYTDQNSIIAAVLVGLAGHAVKVAAIDMNEKHLIFSNDYKGRSWTNKTIMNKYKLSWPSDMSYANPGEVKRVEDLFSEALEQYNATSLNDLVRKRFAIWLGTSQKFTLRDALTDPEVAGPLKLMKNEDWLVANYYPAIVSMTVDALKQADHYLFDVRKFKKVSKVTDIIILDVWPGGSEYALVINPSFGAPYMNINASNYTGTATQKDELYKTVVHELFHVVQPGYVYIDWNTNTFLWEATALTLEREAIEYYSKYDSSRTPSSPIISSISSTSRDNLEYMEESFGLYNTWKSSDESTYIRYGYFGSYFVEYLRDKYNTTNVTKKSFLRSLLVNYYVYCDDVNLTLMQETSKNKVIYSKDFVDFYKTKAMEFAQSLGFQHNFVSVSDAAPFYDFELSKTALSAHIHNLEIAYNSVLNNPEDVYLVFNTPNIEALNSGEVEFVFSYKYRTETILKPNALTVIKDIDNLSRNFLLQANGNWEDLILSDDNNKLPMFMMIKPEAPVLSLNENKVTVNLPQKSLLWAAGIVDTYVVTINNGHGEDIVLYTDEPSFEFDLEDIGIEEDEAGNTISVTVQEETSYNYHNQVVRGPASDNGTSTLTEEELDQQLINANAGVGKITVSMLWSTADDLDLHIMTPSGDEISYMNSNTGGGVLDVDRQASDIVASPIENIYFAAPDSGNYEIFIVNYEDRTEYSPSDYIVRVTVGGESKTYSGSIDGTDSAVNITRIVYGN